MSFTGPNRPMRPPTLLQIFLPNLLPFLQLCAMLLVGGGMGHSMAQPAQTAATASSRSPGAPVALNFVNAEIEAVSRAVGTMINRAIVVDPRVKGQITLYAEKPIPVGEAYLNFLSALRGLGFAMVDAAGVLKVVPEAEAKLQAGSVSV